VGEPSGERAGPIDVGRFVDRWSLGRSLTLVGYPLLLPIIIIPIARRLLLLV